MEKQPRQGKNSSNVFGGRTKSLANTKIYAESPELFSDIIKNLFPQPGLYELCDIGGSGGELMENLLNRLPGYDFKVTVVDNDQDGLVKNVTAYKKLHCGAENIPVLARFFDLTIMRYVLQWNLLASQPKIIAEIRRVTKDHIILQHCGPVDAEGEEWRKRVEVLLNGCGIDALKRKDYYFTSAFDVEKMMEKEGLVFKKVQSRIVDGFTDVFVDRFELDDGRRALIEGVMGDINHIEQTAWIIDVRS